jgi:hypothetical protein
MYATGIEKFWIVGLVADHPTSLLRPLLPAADVLYMDRILGGHSYTPIRRFSTVRYLFTSIPKADWFVLSISRFNLDEQKKQESGGACSRDNRSFISALSGTRAVSFGFMSFSFRFGA